jgi:hypothetical protein
MVYELYVDFTHEDRPWDSAMDYYSITIISPVEIEKKPPNMHNQSIDRHSFALPVTFDGRLDRRRALTYRLRNIPVLLGWIPILN